MANSKCIARILIMSQLVKFSPLTCTGKLAQVLCQAGSRRFLSCSRLHLSQLSASTEKSQTGPHKSYSRDNRSSGYQSNNRYDWYNQRNNRNQNRYDKNQDNNRFNMRKPTKFRHHRNLAKTQIIFKYTNQSDANSKKLH